MCKKCGFLFFREQISVLLQIYKNQYSKINKKVFLKSQKFIFRCPKFFVHSFEAVGNKDSIKKHSTLFFKTNIK